MTEKIKKISDNNVKQRLIPSFHIEADGGGGYLSVLVNGVIGIAEYSYEEVKLITKRESLKIMGESLEIVVFERKIVEIRGKIDNLSICAKKARGGARYDKN